MFPSMLKEYSLLKSSPLTKLKWTKMMSLLTSIHFTMTACLVELKKLISSNIQDAQGLLKRKIERVRKVLRKKRKGEECDYERGTTMG